MAVLWTQHAAGWDEGTGKAHALLPCLPQTQIIIYFTELMVCQMSWGAVNRALSFLVFWGF